MKRHLLSFAFATILTSAAFAADVKVIDVDAYFPEGRIWHHDKLFYVEYARNTVMTRDDKKNELFEQQDGCGPSAVVPTRSDEFLVPCNDSATIGRISADGKTPPPYGKDSDGHPFIGPNDFGPDKQGGIYFTGSVHEGAVIDASICYFIPARKAVLAENNLHKANGLVVSNDGKILSLTGTEDDR
jgi:gluconolactonase